jgi:hypothetical protein
MKSEGSIYSSAPWVAREETYRKNLLDRTGKSLEEWVEIARELGIERPRELRKTLCEAFGLTWGYAGWIAWLAGDRGTPFNDRPENLVDAMFSGSKAKFRLMFDTLSVHALSLGPDARICPCQTIVPFYRRHVIAQVKPLASRLDFGLALGDHPFSARLLDTGGRAKGDRITHRIELREPRDIDAELLRLLRLAYDLNAAK